MYLWFHVEFGECFLSMFNPHAVCRYRGSQLLHTKIIVFLSQTFFFSFSLRTIKIESDVFFIWLNCLDCTESTFEWYGEMSDLHEVPEFVLGSQPWTNYDDKNINEKNKL